MLKFVKNQKISLFVFSTFVYFSFLSSPLSAESPYEILSVSVHASPKEIKTAYRNLAKKYHPDIAPEGKEAEYSLRFQKIHAAYEQLTLDKKSFSNSSSKYTKQARVNSETYFELLEVLAKNPHSIEAKQSIINLNKLNLIGLPDHLKPKLFETLDIVLNRLKSTQNVELLINFISNIPYIKMFNVDGSVYHNRDYGSWNDFETYSQLKSYVPQLYDYLLAQGMSKVDFFAHMKTIHLLIEPREQFIYHEMALKYGYILSIKEALEFAEELSKFTVEKVSFNKSIIIEFSYPYLVSEFHNLTVSKKLEYFNSIRRNGKFALSYLQNILSTSEMSIRQWLWLSEMASTKDKYSITNRNVTDQNYEHNMKELFLKHLRSFSKRKPSKQDIQLLRTNIGISKLEWLLHGKISFSTKNTKDHSITPRTCKNIINN